MSYSVWLSPRLRIDSYILRMLVGTIEITIYDEERPEYDGNVFSHERNHTPRSLERAYESCGWTRVV